MKSLKIRIFSFLLILSLLYIPATLSAKIYNLTILHTNDPHGHFMKFDPYPEKDVGGLAAQSTLVNIIRAEIEKAGAHLLLLSGGDINTGVPESDLLDAEPDIKLMNLIGYDAMVLGNHEFDNPLDVLMKQRKWAEFPFLSANIVKRERGEPLVKRFIMKDFDGLTVAIFGLTTEEVPIITPPEHTKTLKFKSIIDTARELVPELRRKADIVIALTHAGLWEDSGQGHKAAGDLKLAKVVPGIDIIVGGHSHSAMKEAKIVKDTIIVQAGAYSEYVGRLDISFDSDKDDIEDHKYQLLPVNKKKRIKYGGKSYYAYVKTGYMEDPEILSAMKPYLKKIDRILSKPVGETVVELQGGRKESRSQETNLGNLITDAMRAKTGADIAFQNGGGIRAGIEPGVITYRDIRSVLPFRGTLVLFTMTGRQIRNVLNNAAAIAPGSGGFLHVSGLKWTINRKDGHGVAESIMTNGAQLQMNRSYKVVTNSFMAVGGDGYEMFKNIEQMDTGFSDADALMEYVAKRGKVRARIEGRLTILE